MTVSCSRPGDIAGIDYHLKRLGGRFRGRAASRRVFRLIAQIHWPGGILSEHESPAYRVYLSAVIGELNCPSDRRLGLFFLSPRAVEQ